MRNESFDIDIKNFVLDQIVGPLEELRDVCEIAYDEQQIVDITNKLIPELKDNINTCLMEARHHIQNLRNEVNDMMNEVELLQQIFDGNMNKVVIPEYMTLREKKSLLMRKLEPLRKEKDRNISIWEQLKEEERVLSETLGRNLVFTVDSSIPRLQDLDALRLHVRNLNEEVAVRCIEIENLQCEIDNLVEKLGVEREPDISVEIRTNDLTDKYLEKLEEMYSILEKKTEEHKKKKGELINKVSSLWNRINMDVNEREDFLARHKDYRKSAINAFEKEIERCEKLKKLHLADYIQKLRIELTDLLEICKIGDEEKFEITSFDSNSCNDQVADKYEKLIEYYRKFYADNKEIFNWIEKRFKLYDEYVILENATNDPNRLFQNRGGKLLQEENARKKIKSVIPKFDKELIRLIKDYELCHRTKFLYFGRPLEDVIKEKTVLKKKVMNKENVVSTIGSTGVKVLKPFPKQTNTPLTSYNSGLQVPKSTPTGIFGRNMLTGGTPT